MIALKPYTVEELNELKYAVGDRVHFRFSGEAEPCLAPFYTGVIRAVVETELPGRRSRAMYRVAWTWTSIHTGNEMKASLDDYYATNLIPADSVDNPEDPT
jgi:hypothetical protein